MAETVTEKVIEEVVKAVAENGTDTEKAVMAPEGMLLAYSSLMLMALFPVYLGSLKSIIYHAKQKASGEPMDILTTKDAAMFPIIASCALFGLYIVFRVFSKDYVNMLLGVYFFVIGVGAMTNIFSPYMSMILPKSVPLKKFELSIKEFIGDSTEEYFSIKYTTHDLICIALCSVVGVWYLLKKHWIANNILGLTFAINGIELLAINSIMTGALLLGLLFIYDIFWVFGTDVMVTVAKSFDAPIKLVFPQDLLVNGLYASKFAMLGLGDIVIPGIYIALLLRFDNSLNRNTRTYFHTGFVAYILGLFTTIFILHFFKAAQPALLYLVPACVGLPALVALINGEFGLYCKFGDSEDEPKAEEVEGGEEQQEEDSEEVPKRVTRSSESKKDD